MEKYFRKKSVYIILIFLLVFIFVGCKNQEREYKEIRLSNQSDTAYVQDSVEDKITIAINVGLSPLKSLNIYEDFISLLEDKMEEEIDLVQKKSSSEIISLMKDGKVDIALIDSGGYLRAREDNVGQLLVIPTINGQQMHQAHILVNRGEGITEFSQLKGKKIAFTDPWSIEGTVYPMALIKDLGETPETFFANYFYSFCYDKAISALLSKTVDAVSLNGNILDLLIEREIITEDNFKIIESSNKFPNAPIIVRNDLAQKTKDNLKQVLINLGTENEEKKVMSNMNIDRFIIVEESLFEPIQSMNEKVFNYD
ncbi:MAG: phosphate/phosphite/phosphonate ABC transporter substrate-binding protein [Bacillota bacterium]